MVIWGRNLFLNSYVLDIFGNYSLQGWSSGVEICSSIRMSWTSSENYSLQGWSSGVETCSSIHMSSSSQEKCLWEAKAPRRPTTIEQYSLSSSIFLYRCNNNSTFRPM